MTHMVGWTSQELVYATGRPCGIHPLASIGGPPEDRHWKVGDEYTQPVIHETALIHAFCTVDGGMPDRPTTRIGAHTFLMSGAHVGHNIQVGSYCEIGNRTVIGGDATIGDGVKIAGLVWTKPLITIGSGAIIGGGSVVTKDVPAHEVWCGNPARFLKLAWTHPDFAPEWPADAPDGIVDPAMAPHLRGAGSSALVDRSYRNVDETRYEHALREMDELR